MPFIVILEPQRNNYKSSEVSNTPYFKNMSKKDASVLFSMSCLAKANQLNRQDH